MKIMTVQALYAFLEQARENWTEEDEIYLGKFDHQEVRVPYFNLNEDSKFQGYGPAHIHYDGGLGFIIEQPISSVLKGDMT